MVDANVLGEQLAASGLRFHSVSAQPHANPTPARVR
jgi:hypothetical protein